jgi:hypothetical protein
MDQFFARGYSSSREQPTQARSTGSHHGSEAIRSERTSSKTVAPPPSVSSRALPETVDVNQRKSRQRQPGLTRSAWDRKIQMRIDHLSPSAGLPGRHPDAPPRVLVVSDRCVPITQGSGCPMHKPRKWLIGVGSVLGALAAIPAGIWLSLTYQPSYYRAIVGLTREQRAGRARKFVAQSLQLRNDIVNEPTWEAVFTDQEVNAWLAEDLVTYFADQLPPEVTEPRVLFELDHMTLAFQLRHGGLQSVITVVARPRVPGGNTVELTLERIRAGILPVPADHILDRIIEYARYHGVDVEWARRDGYPVVLMRYTPHIDREDVQLEELQIRDHQIRLAGRSDRAKGAVKPPKLPSRQVLQSKFPNLNTHGGSAPDSPPSLQRLTSPAS